MILVLHVRRVGENMVIPGMKPPFETLSLSRASDTSQVLYLANCAMTASLEIEAAMIAPTQTSVVAWSRLSPEPYLRQAAQHLPRAVIASKMRLTSERWRIAVCNSDDNRQITLWPSLQIARLLGDEIIDDGRSSRSSTVAAHPRIRRGQAKLS